MTSITKHTNSLKTYAYAVLFTHLGIFTYFYPDIVLGFIFTIATFIILFAWVDLTYKIEQTNRDNLIILINATENEITKSNGNILMKPRIAIIKELIKILFFL